MLLFTMKTQTDTDNAILKHIICPATYGSDFPVALLCLILFAA